MVLTTGFRQTNVQDEMKNKTHVEKPTKSYKERTRKEM